MTTPKAAILLITMLSLTGWGVISPLQASFNSPDTIHIGVLAKQGKEQCTFQWEATAAYIEEQLPGYAANIVCLAFNEVNKAVEDKLVDFTITNPSVYVDLEYRYGATRIATLKNKRSRNSHTKVGGVIFYHIDRKDIGSLEDLKGKKFMAVAENSFAGWQVAWRLFKDRGIDPYEDFLELSFGHNHETVVLSVEKGVVAAGTVRTDTLERMAWESKIDINDFEVIELQDNTPDFEFLRTTRLYPEWPFAKVAHTSEELAKRVAMVLLQMGERSRAAINSRSRGWTIPLDYHEVHECLRQLRIGPYADIGPITVRDLYQQYKVWIFIGAGILLSIFCGITLVLMLNRKLSTALSDLDREHQHRAVIMADLNEFKHTLDQTKDCVFMFSPETLLFTYANQGALEHIGYSLDELLEMTPADIKPKISNNSFRSMIEPLVADAAKSLTFITIHQKKDTSLIPVEIFLQHITPPGNRGRFVSIVRDISIRLQKEKEKELLQTKLLNEQKMASVGQLAAGIAHEINTPTQYIGTNIDFLDEAFSDIADLIHHYEQLLEAGKANTLSDQLISAAEMAREEADWAYLKEEIPQSIKQSLDGVQQVSSIVLAMKHFSHPGSSEKEMTDLNELIKTTLTVARNEWKHLAETDLQLETLLPPVHSMRNELGQVLLNIIINAAHSIETKLGSNPNGVKGLITIATKHDQDTVSITISDTGCGISEDNIKKVFDPFFTTKEVGKGTGQGLTIAHDIVTNKHNGTLDVVSREGIGATFSITLPAGTSPLNAG